MKTKEVNHSVIVGIFIAVGILILVSAIFVLGGQQKTFAKSFTIHAIFDDINGLQAGDNVLLFGVKVGIIKKVQFYGQKKVEVIMNIEKDAQSRIHKDATAKISTDGFIGNKIIVLDGGSFAQPAVAEDDAINVVVLPGTDQMLATLQENNKNLLEITGNIKTVSQKLVNGQGTAGLFLNDSSMASDIKSAVEELKKVSQRSEMVAENVQEFSKGLNRHGTFANDIVTDTIVFNSVRLTVDNLNKASVNLNNAALKVSSFTDSLQVAGESMNDKKKPVGMILNDETFAANLKAMMINLESSSKKLNDDLEAVQHNFLLRGFFRKKEKDSTNK